MVKEERKQRSAAGGEPLYDRKQSLTQMGNSVAVVIPKTARDILGLERGDQAAVEIYDDGIWIDGGDLDE